MTLKGLWQHLKSHFTGIDLATYHSSRLPALKVQYQNGRVVLNGNHVNYAYGTLHDLFIYAFHENRLPRPWMQKVLILGFGVGNVASILGSYRPDLNMTGVEIAPEMKFIAEEHFALCGTVQPTVHWGRDAVEWISQDPASYDLIILDVFVEDRVPGCLYQTSALQKLDKLLNPGGVLLFNHIANNKNLRKKGMLLKAHMQSLFGQPCVYNFTFGVNRPCVYEKPLKNHA